MSVSGSNRDQLEEMGYTQAVIATLGLSELPGVGFSTLRNLGTVENVMKLFSLEDLRQFVSQLNSHGAKFSAPSDDAEAWDQLKALAWRSGRKLALELVANAVHCITPASFLYPKRLHDLQAKRPIWLFLQGNLDLLTVPSYAVVGTRNPTAVGDFLTKYSVSVLRGLDIAVVSGLAIGVDSIAHEWSLHLGLPTISVLGSGIFVPYPSRNATLAQRIVESGGLLVSEYLPHQGPAADTFVWRNRLQACLADGVIASEWKISSGTAHTVRFGQSMRRPTVSISLDGAFLAGDEGKADFHFKLPSRHAEFVELILSKPQEVEAELPPPESQASLF